MKRRLQITLLVKGGETSYNDGGIDTIKGIYSSKRPTNEIYINQTLYNNAFKNNFSLVVYLKDHLMQNETILKSIRDEGYFYISDSSHEIIQYVDDFGSRLSLLAFPSVMHL